MAIYHTGQAFQQPIIVGRVNSFTSGVTSLQSGVYVANIQLNYSVPNTADYAFLSVSFVYYILSYYTLANSSSQHKLSINGIVLFSNTYSRTENYHMTNSFFYKTDDLFLRSGDTITANFVYQGPYSAPNGGRVGILINGFLMKGA